MTTLTPDDLERFLNEHQLAGQLVRLESKTPTVASAAEAVGADERRIAKSLLFSHGAGYVLAIASGLDRIEPAALAAHLGLDTGQVRLASPAEVLEASGYPVGAMPPLGHRRPLRTLMDQALLDLPEVYAGGGSDEVLLRISPREIMKATGAEVLDMRRGPVSG